MWHKIFIRWGWTGAVVVGLALASTLALVLIADPQMKMELEREAANVKGIARACLRLEREPILGAGPEVLLSLPQVKGVEVFSSSGRRIAGFGEPLEIVGYPLDRQTMLRHASADGARYEVYWPPRVLESEFGVAVRLDIDWFWKKRLSLLLAVAGVQLAAMIAAAALFSRTSARVGAHTASKDKEMQE